MSDKVCETCSFVCFCRKKGPRPAIEEELEYNTDQGDQEELQEELKEDIMY